MRRSCALVAPAAPRPPESDYDRDETIEETAELVTSLGGTGIAVAVDHLDSAQVAQLADHIRHDHGHIDVLVNDIWGGELLKGGPPQWNTPIWELDLDDGLRILRLAIDTHLITSHHLLPLMIDTPGGLVVEVTDGTADYNASRYRISVFYDLAKVSVNRLAFSQGHELAPFGATAVAVTPGWMRSEMMLEAFGVAEENWREAVDGSGTSGPAAPPDFALSESPRYVGRAVVALATDPDRARWNQQSVNSGQLAVGVRLHRCRRLTAGRLAIHGGGRRARAGGPTSPTIARPTGVAMTFRRRERPTERNPRTKESRMPRITPNLWFDTEGEDAAKFYVSVFPNSKITNVTHYGEAGPGPAGTVLTVDFELDGQEYTAINGGPNFTFDEAISLLINCDDQEEVDYYWDKLTDGGEESQCGWLKDKYGLSWQVVPGGMADVLNDPDPERSQRAMKAMLGMKKLDLDALRAAADGV